MISLCDDTQTDIIEAFSWTFWCLDELFKVINPYFKRIVTQIYPNELQ